MKPAHVYDYIICGAGCAGLSLAMHMIHSGQFAHKKIVIIEQDAKQQNDRTWCFWEQGIGLFDSIVKKKWETLHVHNNHFSKVLHIAPYAYKLIRGIDFYNYCKSIINHQPNFKIVNAKVTDIKKIEGMATVDTDGESFSASYVFNSIMFAPPLLKKKDIWMLQHFKGWYIKTEEDAFNPMAGTLMDFRTPQNEGTTFFYALPFSKKEALIEFTLFSLNLLDDAVYERALANYITQQLGITEYTISEKEFGVIPMTNYRFANAHGPIVPLGTAGGYTKGSSGYTFQFIQKASAGIVKSLISNHQPFNPQRSASRFLFYDSVLLQVLKDRAVNGSDIFMQLFQKNNPALVLKFLDNETSLTEELKIISSLPTLPFAKAAAKHIF